MPSLSPRLWCTKRRATVISVCSVAQTHPLDKLPQTMNKVGDLGEKSPKSLFFLWTWNIQTREICGLKIASNKQNLGCFYITSFIAKALQQLFGSFMSVLFWSCLKAAVFSCFAGIIASSRLFFSFRLRWHVWEKCRISQKLAPLST